MVPFPCPSAGVRGCRVPLQLHGHRGEPGGGSGADGESWGPGGDRGMGQSRERLGEGPRPSGSAGLGWARSELSLPRAVPHLGPVGPLDSISSLTLIKVRHPGVWISTVRGDVLEKHKLPKPGVFVLKQNVFSFPGWVWDLGNKQSQGLVSYLSSGVLSGHESVTSL